MRSDRGKASVAVLLALLVLTNAIWIARELLREEAIDKRSAPVAEPRGKTVAKAKRDSRRIARPSVAKSEKPGMIGKQADVPPAIPPKLLETRSQWIAEALQTESEHRRDAAVDHIRTAVASQRIAEILVGLSAVRRISNVDYERDAMRRAILPLLVHEEDRVRALAVGALSSTTRDPAHLDRVLELLKDPSPRVRSALMSAIARLMAWDFRDRRVADAILVLLSDPDKSVVRNTLGNLGHGRFERQVVERLLALAQDSTHRRSVYMDVLAPMREKPSEVVEVLLQELESGQHAYLHQSIVGGLEKGVPSLAHQQVAAAFARLLFVRVSNPSPGASLRKIEQYGDRRQVSALRRHRDQPGISQTMRNRATDIIEKLQKA